MRGASLAVTEGSPSVVNFTGVTPVAGDYVEIYRETPKDISNRTVDFVDASLLGESSLDLAAIHNQFLAQENLDSVNRGLLYDHLGNFQANVGGSDRRIEGVQDPTGEQHAATKAYVDTQITAATGVVGGTAGLGSGQVWELTGDGTTDTFELVPNPTSQVNELFICEVGGVMQAPSDNDGSPARDFKVYYDSGTGKYYLEFEADAFGTGVSAPPNTEKIILQNMGVGKSVLAGSITLSAAAVTDVPMTLRGVSGQTADLFNVQDSTSSVITAVTKDGELQSTSGLLLNSGSGDPDATAACRMVTSAVDKKGLIIRATSGQTANLLEVQDTGGSSQAAITKDGNLGVGLANDGSAGITTQPPAATKAGLIVRGTSATGDTDKLVALQRDGAEEVFGVQNDGTVLSRRITTGTTYGDVYKRDTSGTDLEISINAPDTQAGDIRNERVTGQNPHFRTDLSGDTYMTRLAVGGGQGGTRIRAATSQLSIKAPNSSVAALDLLDSNSAATTRMSFVNDPDTAATGSRLTILGHNNQTGAGILINEDESLAAGAAASVRNAMTLHTDGSLLQQMGAGTGVGKTAPAYAHQIRDSAGALVYEVGTDGDGTYTPRGAFAAGGTSPGRMPLGGGVAAACQVVIDGTSRTFRGNKKNISTVTAESGSVELTNITFSKDMVNTNYMVMFSYEDSTSTNPGTYEQPILLGANKTVSGFRFAHKNTLIDVVNIIVYHI